MNDDFRKDLEEAEEEVKKTVDQVKENVAGSDPADRIKKVMDAAKEESQKVFESAKKFCSSASGGAQKTSEEFSEEEQKAADALKNIWDRAAGAVAGFVQDPRLKETGEKALEAMKRMQKEYAEKLQDFYGKMKENPDVQKTMANWNESFSRGMDKAASSAKKAYDTAMSNESVNKFVQSAKEGYQKFASDPEVKKAGKTIRKGFTVAADTIAKTLHEWLDDDDQDAK